MIKKLPLKLRNIYNYEVVGVAEYQYIQITINSDAHIKRLPPAAAVCIAKQLLYEG